MGASRETHLGDGGAARDAHGGAEGGETDGGDGRHLRVLVWGVGVVDGCVNGTSWQLRSLISELLLFL